MGKKKYKARRKHDARHGEVRFDIPPQVAGIAAAAMRQVDTPAFQQMIAGALGAAARAFDQRRPERPAGGPPPVTPAPPPPAPHAYAPSFEAPGPTLPFEAERALDQATTQLTRAVETAATAAARAIEGAAAAMERWAATQGAHRAGATEDRDGPPHG